MEQVAVIGAGSPRINGRPCEQTIAKKPDIALERSNFHVRCYLKEMEIISLEELNNFRSMIADSYSLISVANATILLKKSPLPHLFESEPK